MKKYQKIILGVALIFIVIFPIWYVAVGPQKNLPGKSFNIGENAIWLEHEWVEKQKSVGEIGDLVNKLGAHRIKYVFVHTGPFESDGKITGERFIRANEFLKTARVYGDKIKYLAWVGQRRIRLDISQPEIRLNIVKTTKFLMDEVGFDGIHFDIEPVYENDSDFLSLLESTRHSMNKGKILSVALPEMMPTPVKYIYQLWMKTASPLSEDIYNKVAVYADQIAVMAYENGIKSPWVYKYFIKNETIWLTREIPDNKKILIGLPSYEKGTDLNGVKSFYPEVENIENGLVGVINGLNNSRSKVNSFLGVAIYLNKETSDKEWEAYDRLWVK
ncbi:MAG: hypothetical protein US89_C0001G0011 [Candidatus Peregrinibacteria bacterium GW2011_GWF2_38_29]|nr:MAG: hypothetical protein US89_C0001G0011 [Candidatus Peregrinibacteria bacterium GW2011_GWF2_38_29]HBB03046.1 hypothetical protein [Candidatus Peregrinibacteria bacterium]